MTSRDLSLLTLSKTQLSKAMLILESDYVTMLLLDTFSGSTYGSPKRMTFKSWRDSVSFISSYITRCDESWKTKPRWNDSYGTLGKNLESVFPTNTKWTDIKGLCVKPTQDSGQVPIASPFLISHAETNILRFSKSYEHVRRDSQESPNGVDNACSRLKWKAPILHFSHKNKSFSDFMPNDARNLEPKGQRTTPEVGHDPRLRDADV